MGILSAYQHAARLSGRRTVQLLFEAALLRRPPSRLGLSEYLDFSLYHTDISFTAKRAFGGYRAQKALEDILIDDYSKILTLDKVSMYQLLYSYDLPTPTLHAVYGTPRPKGLHYISTPQELIQYLTNSRNLPTYLKKSFSAYGRGSALISSTDGTALLLGSGQWISAESFVKQLNEHYPLGWILQEPLTSSETIRSLTGTEKLSGVRIHTFLAASGKVELVRAIFKINVGQRDSDNFEHGATGNKLAAVSLDTGRITRVIDGVGMSQTTSDLPQDDVNNKLIGFQLPYWRELVNTASQAALAFPGFICPGWDIGICENGPRILEVNGFGDIDLSQHAHRLGFMDERFVELLRERRLDGLLYARNRPLSRSPQNGRLGIRRHHWPW